MGDNAVFDVLDQGRMDGGQRGRRQRQVMIAHLRQLVHHHVDNVVTVAEVMVEADGHAVAQPCAADGLLQRGNHLVLLVIPLPEGGGFFLRGAGKQTVVADLVNMRNIFQRYHLTDPPLHRPCCRLHTVPAAVVPG